MTREVPAKKLDRFVLPCDEIRKRAVNQRCDIAATTDKVRRHKERKGAAGYHRAEQSEPERYAVKKSKSVPR